MVGIPMLCPIRGCCVQFGGFRFAAAAGHNVTWSAPGKRSTVGTTTIGWSCCLQTAALSSSCESKPLLASPHYIITCACAAVTAQSQHSHSTATAQPPPLSAARFGSRHLACLHLRQYHLQSGQRHQGQVPRRAAGPADPTVPTTYDGQSVGNDCGRVALACPSSPSDVVQNPKPNTSFDCSALFFTRWLLCHHATLPHPQLRVKIPPILSPPKRRPSTTPVSSLQPPPWGA